MQHDSSLDQPPPTRLNPQSVRRLNKVPIILIASVSVVVLAVIAVGLATRGQNSASTATNVETNQREPATDMARAMEQEALAKASRDPNIQPVPQIPNIDPATQPVPQPTPDTLSQTSTASQQQELTPYQQYLRQLQQQRFQDRLQANQRTLSWQTQAIAATTRIEQSNTNQSGATNPSDPISALQAIQGQLVQQARALTPGQTPQLPANLSTASLGGVSNPFAALAGNSDPNRQQDKESFATRFQDQSGVLLSARTPALSKFEIKRGSVIPGVMVSGINSDLPGRIIGQVSENVYDSVTGNLLLIPQGTKLFGRYDSRITTGQSRVLVIWTDLVFPDGSTLNIMGMPGTSAAGFAGFKDRVDNHFDKIFGAAILTSALSTGVRFASGSDGRTLESGVRIEDAAQEEFAREFGRVATRVVDRNLDIQPTLKIRPGYRFNVLVEKDIILEPPAPRSR